MRGGLARIYEQARSEGARPALHALYSAVRSRVVDDREILVLRVDLTDAKNRLRPRDLAEEGFELLPFSRATLPRVLEMAERAEPWRVEAIRRRFIEGARGFVAEYRGDVVGFVFFTEGTDKPGRLVHSDLRWLGVSPGRREVYAFDYFLAQRARGLGARFARAVQDEQFQMGFSAAYGWVFADNRPAVWLYRTTGWVEVARLTERRLISRLALVGGTLYWMHAHSRTPLAQLPGQSEKK